MGLVYCLDRASVGERWRESDARPTFKGNGRHSVPYNFKPLTVR